MRTLYQTLEQLALELPYGADISQTTRVVALIFHDEIMHLPWDDRHAAHAKLSVSPHAPQHLIALVLRAMQRHARVILLEQGYGEMFEGPLSGDRFSAAHAAIVQRVWDGLSQASAWRAFESQIASWPAHLQEDSP